MKSITPENCRQLQELADHLKSVFENIGRESDIAPLANSAAKLKSDIENFLNDSFEPSDEGDAPDEISSEFAQMNAADEWLGKVSLPDTEPLENGMLAGISQERFVPNKDAATTVSDWGNPDTKTVSATTGDKAKATTLLTQDPKAEWKRIKDLVFDLQKAVSWGNGEMEVEARKKLDRVFETLSREERYDLESAIRQAEWFGRKFREKSLCLESLLKENGFSKKIAPFWKKLFDHPRDPFIKRARNDIARKLKQVCHGYLKRGLKDEAFSLTEYAEREFGRDFSDPLRDMIAADRPEPIEIVSGTEHRIQMLGPEPKWTLFIDESGRFETQDTDNHVVGVLLPKETPLNLTNFHATEDPTSVSVKKHLNELLTEKSGILGLKTKELHCISGEVWLSSIVELILWVWRLLPLDASGSGQVHISVCIEQRNAYDPKKDTELLEKALRIALDRESPSRAKRIALDEVRFVGKNTLNLPWADVVSFMWASGRPEVRSAFRQSGLEGTCCIVNASGLLPIWEKSLRGDAIDADEWQMLMEQDIRRGSINELALKTLAERVAGDAELWNRYRAATEAYLSGKAYAPDVLSRQCAWLATIGNQGFTPMMRFFWKTTELANLNHHGILGDRLAEVVTEIESLLPLVSERDMQASCEAALRLAVSDANAFDFAKAEARLLPWNPDAGGRLTGSAEWDGKILSSLGQYAAFYGKPSRALDYFARAQKCFDILSDKGEPYAGKLKEQTGVYQAIAAMDADGLSAVEKRSQLEECLGMPVTQACKTYRNASKPSDRFKHHALVRYLSSFGSDEERTSYRKGQAGWTSPPAVGRGHPWPIIQWHRWLLAEEEYKGEILNTLFDYSGGDDSGPTIMFIGLVLGIASGMLDPKKSAAARQLANLAVQMPAAASKLEMMARAQSGDLSLVDKVLTFNYR